MIFYAIGSLVLTGTFISVAFFLVWEMRRKIPFGLIPHVMLFLGMSIIMPSLSLLVVDDPEIPHGLMPYSIFFLSSFFYFSFMFFCYVISNDVKVKRTKTHSIDDRKYLGTFAGPPITSLTEHRGPIKYSLLSLIAAAVLLFAMSISAEAPAFSRSLYEQSRSGFGLWVFFIYFNLATSACFALCIANKSARWLLLTLIIIMSAGLGAKTYVFSYSIVIAMSILMSGRYSTWTILAGFFFTPTLLMFFAFIFFHISSPNSVDDIILWIAGYSDTTANYWKLVNTWDTSKIHTYLPESEFFSFIPRAIFPQKPEPFGLIRLAADFFPDRKYNCGASSFGIFGVWYADLGIYSLAGLAILGGIWGLMLGIAERHALDFFSGKKNRLNIFFIPLFFTLSNAPLITFGQGYLLSITCALLVGTAAAFSFAISSNDKNNLAIL